MIAVLRPHRRAGRADVPPGKWREDRGGGWPGEPGSGSLATKNKKNKNNKDNYLHHLYTPYAWALTRPMLEG